MTFASMNRLAGPMLDLPSSTSADARRVKLDVREPIARSAMDLAEFEGPLSFGTSGHSLDETGRLRPYSKTRVLLDVQPILTTPVLKAGEGEETVVRASPTEAVVARFCRRLGWETKSGWPHAMPSGVRVK